jgi:hypothetical protein
VEDQKQDNQDDLVGKLSPTLHQESAGDFTTTVQTIVLSRHLSGSDSVLHTSGGCHGVLSSDTYAIEEESPHVADDPAFLRYTPCCCKHQKTDEHDDRVLDETMTTTKPITENTDEDLSYTY